MQGRRIRVSAVAFLATVAATLAAFVLPGAATSAPPGCANRTNTTYQQLLTCVTLDGVRAHQADVPGDRRRQQRSFLSRHPRGGNEGLRGQREVRRRPAEGAGYNVTLDEFHVHVRVPGRPPAADAGRRATTRPAPFTGQRLRRRHGRRHRRRHQPRRLPPRSSTSGCEAADFAGPDSRGFARTSH